MAFSMIAAIGKNRELGKGGSLVWSLPGDLKYFKSVTTGHPIFMGHRTFDSLPKILPGRAHYVLTRNPEEVPKPAIGVSSLKDFVKSHQNDAEEIFVIGGGMVYWEMLPYCDKLYLTEIDAEDKDADTFFPEFKKEEYQRVEVGKGAESGVNYTFVIYTKK